MNLSAQTLHDSARQGFRRLRRFRQARKLFVRAYAGQYYNREQGVFGQEPLNLAFTAVRALVPNIVTRNPKSVVDSEYIMYREYGNLLALGLDLVSKRIDLPRTLQRGLVDAIFTLGIFKVGLMSTDSLIYFGEEAVDPGTLYVDVVDFDDFTFDPDTRQLETATFLGERIRADRDVLMESELYDNAIVEKLPSSLEVKVDQRRGVRTLSTDQKTYRQQNKLHDYVDLIELWLPGPDVLVTVPYQSSTSGRFLREESYYGPEDGPYAFLTLTPPVPDNPLPVSLAGIWHDLHAIGNRIAKKALDQAEAQKDILGYRSGNADDAQEIVDAKNLEAVRMDDPSGAQMFSFGGQNPQNMEMTSQILAWFDQFSGNTSMLGGTQVQTKVATVANIMQQNASTGITYMKDQTYITTNNVLQKMAWYLHTDPLIKLPLIQRETIPAEYEITAEEIRMISPAQVEETQVFLTPDVRRGDFLDFAFSIKSDSMAPINAQMQLQQLHMLATQIFPSAATAAQISAQMGTPFSFSRFVIRIAKMMDIDWIDEIFQDPELIAQLAMIAKQGPQPQGTNATSPDSVQQNKGSMMAKPPPPEPTRQRQEAQAGAAQGQAALPIRMEV